MDVADWLKTLGLEQYELSFRDNGIDAELLPKLTAEDLKDLGVTRVGDRRRLLEAILALRNEWVPPPASAEPLMDHRQAPGDAERRQITVLFCDLVGSTDLATRLDPEDLRVVITAFQRMVAEIATRFDGFVAKYMGDGALVYFGYPRALEHDAERAVRAGLTLVEAATAIEAAKTTLRVRVGVATGLVVVGDLLGTGPAQERTVVGETPNLAARLQSLAEPDAVLVCPMTRRLVGDLFAFRDMGTHTLKGFATSVPVAQALGESASPDRFEALRAPSLTRLIGREEQLALLQRRWGRAKAGAGQVVLVSGEPGVGKSRLTRALEDSLRGERLTRLRYFCSPHHTDTALYPFVSQLEQAAGIARGDTPGRKLEKLKTSDRAKRGLGRGFQPVCRSSLAAIRAWPNIVRAWFEQRAGKDAPGFCPSDRDAGGPPADTNDLRGRPLERSHLDRTAEHYLRQYSRPSRAGDRDLST